MCARPHIGRGRPLISTVMSVANAATFLAEGTAGVELGGATVGVATSKAESAESLKQARKWKPDA